MQESKKTNYLTGAAILAAASIFVKIIGAIYKIPLFQDGVLGDEGTGDFQVTYSVYSLILTISTAGIPAALSRIISSANAKGDKALVKKYFSAAMPGFFIIGLAAMLVMFFFAEAFAEAMNNSMAALGIRILSPAVFFACIISVYRGYAQGFQNMLPTAISQIVEVLSKTIFGIAIALWFVSLGYESHVVSAGAIVGVTIGLGLCIPLLYWQKRKFDKKASYAREADKTTLASKTSSVEVPPLSSNTSSVDEPPLATGKQARINLFGQILKVSIPITLTAAFMSIMIVIDNSIVLGRLQDALGVSEAGARALFGIYSRALTLYNLPPSILVPVSVSIIPAIAAAIAVKNNVEAKSIMQSSIKLVNLIAMPAAIGLMVLATPILTALYDDQREITSQILVILGGASFFVCLQYITTAILQANGYEKISLITFPIGAALKITLTWFLTGNPNIGILASPIGTLACFSTISVLNVIFIMILLKDSRPKFTKIFLGPAICSLIMAGIAFGVYELISRFMPGVISSVRFEAVAFLSAAILVGVIAYAILIVITRTVTTEDVKLLPKGEKIGKLLRIKDG